MSSIADHVWVCGLGGDPCYAAKGDGLGLAELLGDHEKALECLQVRLTSARRKNNICMVAFMCVCGGSKWYGTVHTEQAE